MPEFERFHTLFATPWPIIGMISLPPLPGCRDTPGMETLLAAALADLAALERGGAAAVLVENDFDQPHALTVGPEVIAAMTIITREVVARASVPVGVQVLLNDWRASLAIAQATGARFVRLDFFVDRVRIKAGEIVPEPEAVLAYRDALGAANLALLTDLQVKYSELLEPGKTLEESARQAAIAGANAVVVTGPATGKPATIVDLRAARAGGVPVIIGSGLTPENAESFVPLADGAIVGTALRAGSGPFDRVDETRVRRLVEACRSVYHVRATPSAAA